MWQLYNGKTQTHTHTRIDAMATIIFFLWSTFFDCFEFFFRRSITSSHAQIHTRSKKIGGQQQKESRKKPNDKSNFKSLLLASTIFFFGHESKSDFFYTHQINGNSKASKTMTICEFAMRFYHVEFFFDSFIKVWNFEQEIPDIYIINTHLPFWIFDECLLMSDD